MRILEKLNLPEDTKLQDVKHEPISQPQLNALYNVTHSYEQLINKRSRVLQALNKAGKTLDETVFKTLLETEHSCIKRPILQWENNFYLGNAKNTVVAMQQAIHG
jgi:arsenate reductase-like glutaredoxin family protein